MSEQPPQDKKVWFIKDEAISDVSQDEFAHADLARELKEKIVCFGAPLTLSLEGKHGTGKSVVGSLLKSQFKDDSRYEFVRIEAWRHSGESRRKAFLYDVIEGLKTNRLEAETKTPASEEAVIALNRLQSRLYHSHAEQHAELSFKGIRASWDAVVAEAKRPAVRRFFIFFAIAVVLLTFWLVFTSNTNLQGALQGLIVAAPGLLSLGVAVYFGTMLSKMIEKLVEPAKITFTTAPPSSSEQFEQIFRETIAATAQGQPSGRTLVVLVDELDRLPVGEIIDAINVVRTFRDVNPCVVVVALDPEVVVRALKQVPKETAGMIRDDEEAEEFLNKFFKFRQHIPPLVKRDMQAFARSLIESRRLTGGIGELEGAMLDDVLDGLLHPGVTTPRHVIRMLNSFNSGLRLAQRRERSKVGGKTALIASGSVTRNLPFLAVITAIGEDYADFHADLVRNPQLISVIEKGISGAFAGGQAVGIEVKHPGYREVCAKYFRTVAPVQAESDEDGSDVALPMEEQELDWGRPHPAYRDLVLHLQSVRRLREASINPFVFFREDVPSRAIGSGQQAQEMVEEFWSNYVPRLIGRFQTADEIEFPGAAATVALHCLQEGRGGQRKNALLSVCALFDRFDSLRAAQLSDAVCRTADEMRDIFNDLGGALPADQMLSVIEAHPMGFHQKACIEEAARQMSNLAASLSGSEAIDDDTLDRAEDLLKAAAKHFHLFTEADQRQSISHLADIAMQKLPPEGIKGWLDTLAEEGSAAVREELFTAEAWNSIVASLIPLTSKQLPQGVVDSLRKAVSSVKHHALNVWPRTYFTLGTRLQESIFWPLRDVGFEMLENDIGLLHLDEAKAALKALATSASQGLEKRNDAETIYPRMASWMQAVGNHEWEGDLLQDKDLETILDKHCAAFVVLASEPLRRAAYKVLLTLAPISKLRYGESVGALTGDIEAQRPAMRAEGALQILLSLPREIGDDDLAVLFQSLSAPLQSLTEGKEAVFAANALLMGLDPERDESIAKAAMAQAEALVSLISTSYTPSQLENVSRVLERAAPRISELARQSYITNLNAVLAQSNTPPQLLFALDKLESLRRNKAVPEALLPVLSANIITAWPRLSTVESRALAAGLLMNWSESIDTASLPTHLSNMAALAGNLPESAWKASEPFWTEMSQDQRNALISSLMQTDAMDTVMKDMSNQENLLEPGSIAALISGIDESAETEQADGLAPLLSALVANCDAEAKNAVAQDLFAHIAEQPEPMGYIGIFEAACGLQSEAQEAGAAVLAALLRGDSSQSDTAWRLIPAYLGVSSAGESVASTLLPALAPHVASARGEKLQEAVGWLERLGWLAAPDVEGALRQAYDGLKRTRSKDARADREVLKSALRKVPKASSN